MTFWQFIDKHLDRVWDHIDKFIVLGMWIATFSGAIWLQRNVMNMDEGTADWVRTMSASAFAGLMGLVTGRAIERYKQGDKSNGQVSTGTNTDAAQATEGRTQG